MKNTILKFAIVGITSVALASCIKDDVEELGDAGGTYIKFQESLNQLFFEPFSGTRPVRLFSIRRDANSNAELNKSVTVTVRVDTAAITEYNQTFGTSFELLPDSLFSVNLPYVTQTGPLTYDITFGPGEFAKEFYIELDGDKWDLAYVYSMPFEIIDAGGLPVLPSQSMVNAQISLKNEYDGKYLLKSYFYHPTASLQGAFSFDMEMHTSGTNSVKMYWPLGGDYGHPFTNNGSPTWFAAQEPEYTIDPVTLKVTVQNSYPGAVTFYQMAPNYDSHYDPATRTIYAKFGYNYGPGGTFDPSATREWTDTLIYTGPR